MRFARLGAAGQETPVVLVGETALDLRSVTDDIDGGFLSTGLERAQSAITAGDLPEVDGADALRIGPPIARPSAVYCIGMNYAAHAAESGSAPPEHLVLFMKAPNTVVGPNDPIVLPRGSTATDWEVELGVVIGRRAHELDSEEEARSVIAGYTMANDLSERHWQLAESGGQWSKGKSAPGFCPTGPWLITADEFTGAGDVRLRSWVNGDARQDSGTRDLIIGIDRIVLELSRFLVLEPGDLVLTGTPEGVALSGRFPYLADGDVVELEIDGLGRQRQPVRAAAPLGARTGSTPVG